MADVVKVMVEVENISVIPKVIQCSYKAITDNKYRFYNLKVIPSATCLPVLQWTEENYRSYGEEGGSRESEEEGWEHDGEATLREEAGRRARNEGDAQGVAPEGATNVLRIAEGDADMQDEVLPRADDAGHEGKNQGGARMHALADEKAEEKKRRRKEKGIIKEWAHGAKTVAPQLGQAQLSQGPIHVTQ